MTVLTGRQRRLFREYVNDNYEQICGVEMWLLHEYIIALELALEPFAKLHGELPEEYKADHKLMEQGYIQLNVAHFEQAATLLRKWWTLHVPEEDNGKSEYD